MRRPRHRRRRLGPCLRPTHVGEGQADPAETAEPGGASTSQAAEDVGTSSQAYLPSTPQTQGTAIPSTMSSPSQQAFLDGLSSSGFQQMISDIMLEGGSGYRPDAQFDGSQVHLDLNEHVSGPSWLLVGLLHQPHTCQVDLGRYRSWSLPVCRLLQRHLHRLSSQTNQQHVGGPA
ncbi:hypothetical protein PIB30_070770 [Stylosanthes scabra]|uniref:Uncharacterized protein n=1 Tax=Stylosanthes scabra TaxID=79078 RepID=A0ABU6ZM78_9FABA|nr:hypothetical protein [Stylosanthes scabra]